MDQPELRHVLRRWLAGRPLAAVPAERIVHGLALWGDEATAAEVATAATYLAGLEPAQIRIIADPLAAGIKHYQITTAGIAAYEANA